MDFLSIKTIIEVFNAVVKPILLYGSEIWGCISKKDNSIEKVQLMFGKFLLGVHRKVVNINMAVLGELCLRPLKIDMQQNPLKYYDYIAQNNTVSYLAINYCVPNNIM